MGRWSWNEPVRSACDRSGTRLFHKLSIENKGLTWAEFANADSRDHGKACLERGRLGPPYALKKERAAPRQSVGAALWR
jgi:hypothetical protein